MKTHLYFLAAVAGLLVGQQAVLAAEAQPVEEELGNEDTTVEQLTTQELQLQLPAEPVRVAQEEVEEIEVEPMNSPQESDNQEWTGTLEVYGFAPLRTEGTTTVRGRDADFDLSLGDTLDVLDWFTYIRGSVERGRWGAQTDLSYVTLSGANARTGRSGRATGKAKVGFDQGIYDFALRYRFGDRESAIAKPKSYSVIPYLGIRVLDLESDLKFQVRASAPSPVRGGPRVAGVARRTDFRRQGSFGRTWVQPLVGVQGSYFLSPRLRAFAQADIAGFNISGDEDLSGNVKIGLGYAVGDNTDINLSFRYLGIRYENDKNPESGFSSDQPGLELGIKFFF